MATAVDFITILHLCYCYSLVLAGHPALSQWPLLSKYTASRLTFRLLPTNHAVMLNIISTLCNELNYHQVTVTCWVSGSLRQIWYAHFFCWHYNKVLSCSVPYKSLVSYTAKIHQSLKVSVQSGHWTHSWSATHVLLQECITAQCHGQQRGRRLAPRICCCCKDFPQEFLPWSMLICCHLSAASLVTVINLTNLQWWNVTK